MQKLIIVFGLPGAGKSYAADVLAKSFGFTHYNGDSDIPDGMRDALWKKEKITDDMRRHFIANMIASVKKIATSENKLVIHQTFLKEFMRKQFLEAFPHAQFLLIETPTHIREARYMKRKYFNLGLKYLRHMSALFEPVQIPHSMIINSKDGKKDIKGQLEKLLEEKTTPDNP